jgi:membrane protein implicated in regulation of membrane protease activity
VLAAWHVWIVVAIMLLIFEVLIPAFVLASFGIGCLISSLAALLNLGLKVQIAAFILGTLAAFFGIRPFFTKYCYKASQGIKTNVDALVGKTGRVTEVINDELNSGRVLVGGDDWKAVALDGSIIEKNSKVEVVRVEGNKAYVRLINRLNH